MFSFIKKHFPLSISEMVNEGRMGLEGAKNREVGKRFVFSCISSLSTFLWKYKLFCNDIS